MRALLLYPRFPRTLWSYENILALIGRKVLLPPLSLPTVAALLPQNWEFRLVDRNVRPVTEAEWEWAEIVLLTAMIVQREDFAALIAEARRRGKPVVVGGPYATSVPEDALAAGADFLVLDEGEVTIPLFLEALASGQRAGVFRADGRKPDVTATPVPRYDLLELPAYDSMAIQFSRGCPFLCEFCDIITLYGRVPRTKTPAQMLAELQCLYDLGWRRSVFVVDDNFVGNKHKVKDFLRELLPWQESHGFPFSFDTQASVDLAQDEELLNLMVACGFSAVFLGIETPDPASLKATKKYQNANCPPVEAVDRIARAGLRPMAGFIIGFDGEAPGAGRRVADFIEAAAIPATTFSMLQALPNTALWDRLQRQGRLLPNQAGLNQSQLMNFLPTRPLDEIAREYLEAFHAVYDPVRYLERAYRCFLRMAPPPRRAGAKPDRPPPDWRELRAALIIAWRQGLRRRTRWRFWYRLAGILLRNPRVWQHYLTVCAHAEHFLEFRETVRQEIEAQLAAYRQCRQAQPQKDSAA